MDREWDELCEEYGNEIVGYVSRCFHLRAWRKVHGSYPYDLDYLMLKSILAIQDEVSLREAKISYDSIEKSRRVTTQGGSGASNVPSGGIKKGVPVNRF